MLSKTEQRERIIKTEKRALKMFKNGGDGATVNKLFSFAAADTRRLLHFNDLLTFWIVVIAFGGDGVPDDDCKDCMSLPFIP